jgi:hypothetical protein
MPERRGRKKRPLQNATGKNAGRTAGKKDPAGPAAGLIPGLVERALGRHDDIIVTCEVDPDTDKKTLYLISGRFVTPCMLRKLIGQAESQRDDGSILIAEDLE